MKKLYGVTVAMVTPMFEDGSVDLAGVAKLTEMLVGKGVQCLYPCGTTGEMLKLTTDERKAIAETVVKTAAGRVTVFIHTGAESEEKTLELSLHAHKIGADGVGIVTPQFFGCSDRMLVGYYSRIANKLPADFPIYLYGIPQCAANDISAVAAKELFTQCPNIVGIKYSFLDMVRTTAYLDVAEDFSVLHGSDRHFSSMLAMGCDGTVSGVSSASPEAFVKVWNAWNAGDMAEVRKWQKAGREMCDILKNGSDMAVFKGALKIRGLDAGHMRLPQLDLTQAEFEELEKKLTDWYARWGLELKV